MKISKGAYLMALGLFSHAALASIQPGWLGNWYVGASVGYSKLYGEMNTSLTYNGALAPVSTPSTRVQSFSDGGALLSLLAGYQEIKHQWLVGGEINFDLQHFEQDHHYVFSDFSNLISWDANGRFVRKKILGLSGRTGYAVTPFFMPYLKLGIEFSNDKYQASFSGNPSVFPVEMSINEVHWTHRFLIGAGVEVPIPETCGATLRLEYDMHSKGRTIEGNSTVLDGRYSPTIISGVQPKVHSARLSIIWNFF